MQQDTDARDLVASLIAQMALCNPLTQIAALAAAEAGTMRDLMERIATTQFSDMRLHNPSLPKWVLDQLVRLHVDAQNAAYLAGFPDAVTCLIRHDGRPVGRYVLTQRPQRLHVVDLALLPEVRGFGIGTDVLTATIASGRALGIDHITLSVAAGNHAAQRLYHRLGFRIDAMDDGASPTLSMTLRLVAAKSTATS